jgi:hypothetical protein
MKKPSQNRKNRAKPEKTEPKSSQTKKNRAKPVWTGFCSKKPNRNMLVWTGFSSVLIFFKNFSLIIFFWIKIKQNRKSSPLS